MKRLLLILLAGFNFAFSQSVTLSSFEAPASDKNTAHLKEFTLLQFDVNSIQAILNNTKGNIYRLQLITPHQNFNLELYEYSVLPASNRIRNTGGIGSITRLKERKDLRTFKGIVNGINNSIVTMTIADGFFKLMIDDHKDRYFLEQYGTYQDQFQSTSNLQKFVLYKGTDLIANSGISCGVTDLKKGLDDVQKVVKQTEVSLYDPCRICIEVQIAIGADYTMFTKYGGIGQVDAFIVSNLAAVQTVFDDEWLEYEISYQLTGEWISDDKATDPFFTLRDMNSVFTTFQGNAATLFAGAEYDVASLWTAKFTSGTVEMADQPGVCASNKYNVVSSFMANVLTSPFYLTLQAHVLGHNFNASHDPGLSPTIMNAIQTQATSWSNQSIRDIFSYIYFQNLAGSCLSFCPNTGVPVPDFIADVTYGCQPLTVKFKDASMNTTKWKWRFPGGMPDSSLLQNPTVVYKVAGRYAVTLESSNKWCTTILTRSEFIVVNDEPVADFIYGLQGREIFFVDQSPRATEWHWYFGDGDESFDQFPAHEYPRDTTYEVTLIVANDCGTDTIKKKILVESIPLVDFSSDLTLGCAPQVVKFLDQSSNNVKTWQWEFVGGVPAVSTAQNPVIRYNLPGKYDVKLTVYASKYHSSLTKTFYITIDSIPIASFTNQVNVGQVMFANQSRYAKNHLWVFGDNTTSNEENPTHNYTEGTYKVLYIVSNDCGTDTAETTLTIGTKPIPGFQTSNLKGCTPYKVQFQNTSVAATSYKWYFPGGNPSTSTDPNPLVTYNSAGKFNVSLVASNVFYSDSIGKADYIEARSKPSGGFNVGITGFTSTFTNTTTAANNYLWDFGDKKVSFEKDPVHNYGVEGEFKVRLISQNECGGDTITKLIAIYLVPKVNFAVANSRGCPPFKVQFMDKSSVDVVEWDWQFENGNPSTSKEKNPMVVFDKLGKFTVKLTVKNTNGSNSITRTQFIQVVSTVLCPEQTKTNRFMLSEDPFGVTIQDRAQHIDESTPFVYPNPASDHIYVNTGSNAGEPATLEVYDLSGKKLSSLSAKETLIKMQTDQLKPGTYYVKITNNRNSVFCKFVISE